MMLTPLNQHSEGRGKVGLYEFRASQIYIVRSKPTLVQINKY